MTPLPPFDEQLRQLQAVLDATPGYQRGRWRPIHDSTAPDEFGGLVGIANSYPGRQVGGDDR